MVHPAGLEPDSKSDGSPRRGRNLFLQPEINQRLGGYSALARDLSYLTKQVIRYTDIVGAAFQLHLEVRFRHVLFIVGATVRVPEFAGFLSTAELLR